MNHDSKMILVPVSTAVAGFVAAYPSFSDFASQAHKYFDDKNPLWAAPFGGLTELVVSLGGPALLGVASFVGGCFVAMGLEKSIDSMPNSKYNQINAERLKKAEIAKELYGLL